MAIDDEVEAEVSLSTEQTNALRAKLGLKPLTVGNKTSQEEDAERNYSKHKAEENKKSQRRALVERIAKEKELAIRNKKLEGSTLGDASEDVDDPLIWIKKQKEREAKQKAKERTRQAELARKKAEELAELDQSATEVYGKADLKGLRVDHSLQDVASIGETILTLKDSMITEDDEEGDVLMNVNLADNEKSRKNVDNKKKRPGYNAYDDQGLGEKKNLLSQYDDEAVQESFTIDENGTVDLEQRRQEVSEKLREGAISLAYEKTQEIKDYYTKDEIVAFKKPRKKKKSRKEKSMDGIGETEDIADASSKRSRRRRPIDDEEEGAMDTDPSPNTSVSMAKTMRVDYELSNKKSDVSDINFVDDDDLQSALARARQWKVKQSASEELERLAKAAMEIQDDESVPEGSAVLSATSEFVRTLASAPVVKTPEVKQKRPALPVDDTEDEPAKDDMDIDVEVSMDNEEEEKGGWAEENVKKSGSESLSSMPLVKTESGDMDVPAPIEDEPLVGAGLAATVALLNQKGFVARATPEDLERDRRQTEKRLWLAEQRRRDALKEMEKEREKALKKERNKAAAAKGKGGGGGHDDRDRDWYREEQEARYAERERLREVEERYKSYIPEVKIAYHDDHGRELSTKEAFRQLSHKFHGKSSGKMKTEKRLKKLEDDLKMERMTSNDTPLGTAHAFSERTKAAGAAHLVLGVGNRSILPPEVSLSETKPIAKAPRTQRTTVTTTTVIDTDRNVNTYNREKVAFGLAMGQAASTGKRKQSSPDDNASKRMKQKE
ncbi:SART-1 protein [Phlyctochytrium arcticum]|nr:SART-1 protein [Phlyctochytrium arcticum]